MALTAEQSALVEAHLRLAHGIAWRWTRKLPSNAQIDREDLSGVTLLALCAAAQSYDAATSVPFHTHAAFRIDCAVKDYLRLQYPVSGIGRVARRNGDAENVHTWALDGVEPAMVERLRALTDLSPAAAPDRYEAALDVLKHLRRLPRREVAILLRWARGEHQRTIGARLGLSESRVSQLRTAVVEALRWRLATRPACASRCRWPGTSR